jgi:ribonucleoside-diphosphate reductase alpha chain
MNSNREMSSRREILSPIASQIWREKYRFAPVEGAAGAHAAEGAPVEGKPIEDASIEDASIEDASIEDTSIEDTWRRVAVAAAAAEAPAQRALWAGRFYDAMSGFAFIPAGRILAGAGTGRDVTLFNCFVMGRIADDMGSIFESVKEAALTMQRGGGVGCDFSTLRPRGARVRGAGADASGPVSFMDVWDAMCRTIMSAGSRRGAMMGVLSCEHPDIELFIDAKADPARLRMFNLSVLVTSAFMKAVREDAAWDLSFGGAVYRTLPARALWDRIMRAAYDYAEPGVIFIDRVNAENNLQYCETISSTNPCGEQPLPPYGACLLGSINLARLVRDPFEASAALDEDRLAALVPDAVRFLDNVIDISGFPLEAQRREARAKRRIGLGVTGLADALIMCGRSYGSAEAVALAQSWMARIERLAYAASAGLAAEKGAFPLFDAGKLLARPAIARLPEDIRSAIARGGLRNGCLTSIAPTGTISLLAGNVSSGVEPAFDFVYRRRILTPDDGVREEMVEDYAHRLFRRKFGPETPLPGPFVAARDLSPAQHLAMQAALQTHVDSSISKTVNCPEDITFDAFKDIYARAYALGLKGCAAYRPNPVTGAVLTRADERPVQPAPPLEAPAAPTLAPEGHMVWPLKRDAALAGFTYKLRWPDSDHAIYVTINDITHEGRLRPFEIFINSKNLEHYAWTVALTRMISAVFRRGGDVSFVVEELKAVFDPRGGQWMEGRYVPSLLAAIGGIIERHMVDIGFLERDRNGGAIVPKEGRLKTCPRCGSFSMVFQEGCFLCRDCGYSKCS